MPQAWELPGRADADPGTFFRGRTCVAAAGLTLALGCGGAAPGGDSRLVDGLHLPPESRTPLECERMDFPCSWAQVDPDVLTRSLALGREALGRSRLEGIPAARAWLENLDGMVEVRADSSGLVFRLVQGRRVWVETVSDSSRFGRAVRQTGETGSIIGIDQNGDDKLNQRDRRRALVLDPYLHEAAYTGYQGGPRAAALLEGSPAFAGQVTLQVDDQLTLGSYQAWDQYDLITVFSHSGVKCAGDDCLWLLWLGLHLDPAISHEDIAALKAQMEPIGLELRVRMADGDKTKAQAGDSLYWSIGASADFFRHTYPRGLDRKIIVIGSCASMDPAMIMAMTGPRRPEASAYFGFTNLVDARDAEGAVITFLEHMVHQGLSARQAWLQMRKRGLTRFVDEDGVTEFVGYQVQNPRAREIINLVDQEEKPLRDGDDLDALVAGSIGDGMPDSLNVTALVEGVITGNEDPALIDHTTGSESVHMEAWLELDGKPIGRAEGLLDKPKNGNIIRIDFRNVPVGFDLERDKRYELEAVLLLPPERKEDGESRYSVRLAGASCSWRISYRGARTGEYSGNYVMHMHDFVTSEASFRDRTHLTRRVAFQKRGTFAITIGFGEDGLPLGRNGSLVLGADPMRGERLTLDVDLDFPWQNRMTGENRAFSVRIDRNDADVLAGSFDGNLLNVPRRAPHPDPLDHGDIEVEGEFVWRRGRCRPE